MSEMNNRNPRDYAKYDTMSTEQLQELLRLDARQTEGEGMDTEELFYLMEVLTVRRKNNPATAGKTLEEAKAEFKKHYMPKEAKVVVFPAWLRRATAVVAVVAVFLFVATASVNAFGYDLWGKVAVWSKEFFHFEDESSETRETDPAKQDDFEYGSLQEALDGMGIRQRLAPSWLPEGFLLDELFVFRSPKENSISAKYTNSDTEIRVSIRQLIDGIPEEIEKSEDYIMAYDANGVTYFIFENNKLLQAVWVIKECECFIAGELTIDEMKAIIDSI